jgi:hypothetical protein
MPPSDLAVRPPHLSFTEIERRQATEVSRRRESAQLILERVLEKLVPSEGVDKCPQPLLVSKPSDGFLWLWGAFIRSACLPAASRADPIRPRRPKTSFCPSDTHGPRVPALVERTYPCAYAPGTFIGPSGKPSARAVVKSSIRRARVIRRCMSPCRCRKLDRLHAARSYSWIRLPRNPA